MKRFYLIIVLFLINNLSVCAQEEKENQIPISKNQIVKLEDTGISPLSLVMKKEDSIVFFLNSTKDSLATIELDYGNHTTHCASSNLKIQKNGIVSSVRPIEPKNFASVCFHDAGTYPVKVYGLKIKPQGVVANIIVE